MIVEAFYNTDKILDTRLESVESDPSMGAGVKDLNEWEVWMSKLYVYKGAVKVKYYKTHI